MPPFPDLPAWEARCRAFVANEPVADAAHDPAHLQRVVHSARRLAAAEGADLAVVLPAAWLHDCVAVSKFSPDRPRASRLAAARAVEWLAAEGYPAQYLEAIGHAVEAHSFSARIPTRTLEAQVVQDADRLDSLGAIGIARCFATGGSGGRAFYAPEDPFCTVRAPDEATFTLDHFYAKLLTLESTMQTVAGRAEAARRTVFLRDYLAQLADELGTA